MACSYQCPERLHLLPGHWPKRSWISSDLQKQNLFANNPSNIKNNTKSQIKNKNQSLNLWNY